MTAVVVLIILALHAVVAVAFYRAAIRKGRSGAWALFGLSSPLGWLVGYALLSNRTALGAAAEAEARARDEEEAGMNECESCGALNAPTATECRKCRRPLRADALPST